MADSRREAVGRPARPFEGGPDGDDRADPAGRSRGGRGACPDNSGEPQQPAFEALGGYDSPPGRHGIYHDLDAGEGQDHG